MFTQCPHCQTFFRINSAQLKAAAGKARCCQCKQVFNALENLQEQPHPPHPEDDEPFTPLLENDPGAGLFTQTLNLDVEQLIDEQAMQLHAEPRPLPREEPASPVLECNDGLEPEPDYFAAGSESQMSALLDQDSRPHLAESEAEAEIIPLVSRADEAQASGDEPPQGAANDLPQAAPSTGEPALSQTPPEAMFERQPFPWAGLAWGLGSLLLLALLTTQVAWLKRDQLVEIAPGQAFLQGLCRLAGCQPPLRRDLSKIAIIDRDLRANPDRPDVLDLHLGLINRAAFSQPYPKLRLSLYDDNERLIARRTFLPREYLRPEQRAPGALMPSARGIDIAMQLRDPGKEVTGFKFEFL